MGRHIRSATPDNGLVTIRRQVSCIRRDLLLDGEAVHPATGEFQPLPAQGANALIGPSIAHTLVRRVVPAVSLPPALRCEAEAANGGELPAFVALWTLLDTGTLWRTEELPPPREPSTADEDRQPEHPFKPQLVTGGTEKGDDAPGGWVAVRKSTTTWVSDGAFRLAAAMHGSADEGAKRISGLSVDAWDQDLERCLELHALVAAAGPDGLLETDEVMALRPASSVSQEVEKQVLDEALVWLGVDPREELRRTPGRRRKAGDDGDVLAVDVDGEGRVHGQLRRTYGGWPATTALTDIALPRLVELLGLLRTERLGTDADMLEAYLDAAHPAWREAAADEPAPAAGGAVSDPWEVLGIPRDSSRDAMVAAYRRLMMKVHPDTGGLPPWMSRAVSDAYRTLKDAMPAKEDA